MFTFRWKYFALALFLLLVEIGIALFIKDRFVRPYVGDFLIVIFMYCLARSFWQLAVTPTAILVLLFAYAIEILQYFNLVAVFGLQHSQVARTLIGTFFEWGDLVAYTLGVLVVLAVEILVTIKYAKI